MAQYYVPGCLHRSFDFTNMALEAVLSKEEAYLGPVWYMCLKTENCCLKIFVEIRVGEKVH